MDKFLQNSCGLISNVEGIVSTDYILIGCDCVKYKKNDNIVPNDQLEMIEVIDKNKITLDLLNCIYIYEI